VLGGGGGGGGGTREKLDRFFGSAAWFGLFPTYHAEALAAGSSDHSPLFLSLQGIGMEGRRKRRKRFHFEDNWVSKPMCQTIIDENWLFGNQQCPIERLMAATDRCASSLRDWDNDVIGDIPRKVKDIQDRLLFLEPLPRTDVVVAEEGRLESELGKLVEDEEVLARSKSRALWLQAGDRNTKFFHARTTSRRKKNEIKGLENKDGVWCTEKAELTRIISDFYSDLFSSSNPVINDDDISGLSSRVSAEQNSMLTAPFSAEEIRVALFQMNPSKAPGLDGMTTNFYQKFWPTVGDTVVKACLGFLNDGIAIPEEFNKARVVLIPKKDKPRSMGDLRPISLCNVSFKIISKALANRLKCVLPSVISENQSAFVPGRLISDNLLVASEVLHWIKGKTSSMTGWMAVKLDMSKAYDRVEWEFLERVMVKLGFDFLFIKKIMECVRTVSYVFSLNGDDVCQVKPSRGLRQGDSISPYLFLLISEGLSMLLQHAQMEKKISGVKICRSALSDSHLLFADDSILFYKANQREAKALRELLLIYEA